MKGSLIIIMFFIAGILCGRFADVADFLEQYDISFYALLALLFAVGFSIGNDPQNIQRFKHLNWRLMLLPLCTIAGTLTACLLVGLAFSHRSIGDYMAVGSGFAYYSLSSILITQYKGAELGTVALLCNLARELITLLGAPLMVRFFGPLAPISSGGATTMDTTLPIITRTAGTQYAIVSIFHGFIVDFSVPFLVTFFCSL